MSRSDRLASLDSVLASPRRPKPALPESVEAESPPTPDVVEVAPAQPKASRSRPTRSAPRSESSTGGRRRVPFKLDPELKRRLIARARADETSQGNVVKLALEEAVSTGALVDAFAPAPSTSMFTLTEAPVARATALAEIQLLASEIDLLDGLCEQYGAKDRTALITKCLELYL